MAEAYLTESATSLAAANWSDATGFANGATLVINKGAANIQSDLDQSATSITSLDVLEGFSGTIGGVAGALKCDADGTSEAATTVVSRIRYKASGGSMFFEAAGGNTLAHYVQVHSAGGRFYGVSGIMKNVHVGLGEARFASAVLMTSGEWELTGGSCFVDYHASNGIPTLYVNGGSHTIKRGVTTGYFGGGTTTFDVQSVAIGTLNVFSGGSIRLLNSGAITAVHLRGGVFDTRELQRSVTIGTLKLGAGATYIRSPMVTVTNLHPLGGVVV